MKKRRIAKIKRMIACLLVAATFMSMTPRSYAMEGSLDLNEASNEYEDVSSGEGADVSGGEYIDISAGNPSEEQPKEGQTGEETEAETGEETDGETGEDPTVDAEMITVSGTFYDMGYEFNYTSEMATTVFTITAIDENGATTTVKSENGMYSIKIKKDSKYGIRFQGHIAGRMANMNVVYHNHFLKDTQLNVVIRTKNVPGYKPEYNGYCPDNSIITRTLNEEIYGKNLIHFNQAIYRVNIAEGAPVVTVGFQNGIENSSFDFTIEDTTIATVDKDGTLTGLKVGKTILTAALKAKPDDVYTVAIEVYDNPYWEMEFSAVESEIFLNCIDNPKGKVEIQDGDGNIIENVDELFTFQSGFPSYVKVDEKGNVEALKPWKYSVGITAVLKCDREVCVRFSVHSEYVDTDTDGDGFTDIEELFGVDTDDNGEVDVPIHEMGADPNRPDIFVQVDWMEAKPYILHDKNNVGADSTDAYYRKDYRPAERDYEAVMKSFHEHGINLHIDMGPNSVVQYQSDKKWGDIEGYEARNPIPYQDVMIVGPKNGEDNNYEYWIKLVEDNLLPKERQGIFRHALIVNRVNHRGKTDISGLSLSTPGPYFIVADIDHVLTEKPGALGRTFMHELGHSLGLSHGGTDITGFKPNYLSIMNYAFQISGLHRPDYEDADPYYTNYSEFVLPSLNEFALDETVPLDPEGKTKELGLGTAIIVDAQHIKWITSEEMIRGNVDFNFNGSTNDTNFQYNINKEHNNTTPDKIEYSVLSGAEDWSVVKRNCRYRKTQKDVIKSAPGLSYQYAVETGIAGYDGSGNVLEINPLVLNNTLKDKYVYLRVVNFGSNAATYTLKVESNAIMDRQEFTVDVEGTQKTVAYKDVAVKINDDAHDGEYIIKATLSYPGKKDITQSIEVRLLTADEEELQIVKEVLTGGESVLPKEALNEYKTVIEEVEGIKTYNIVYYLDGGINSEKNVHLYEESGDDILLYAPIKEGFIFAGWYKKSDFSGERLEKIAAGSAEDVTLYAKWMLIHDHEYGEDLKCKICGQAKEVPDDLWCEDVPDYVYTGKAITPELVVYNGTTRLVKGKDYTLSYKNNTNAGTATIIVKGKGNYTGSDTKEFVIRECSLEELTIPEEIYEAYTGKVIKPAFLVTRDKKVLKSGTDYTITVKDNKEIKEAGDYELILTGTGNYEGTKVISLRVAEMKNVSKLSVFKPAKQNYANGNPIEPVIIVKDGSKELTRDVDYELTFENNFEIGTAKIILTGKGNYAGSRVITFDIVGTPVSKVKVEGITNLTYTGNKLSQGQLQLSYNGVALKDDEYEIAYQNNVKVGTATIFISGKKGFSGTVKKTFKILPYEVKAQDTNIQYNIEKAYYQKGGSKPNVRVTHNSSELMKNFILGVDYTVSYKNNTRVANSTAQKPPTAVIKFKGNYKGTIEVKFDILPQDLSLLTMVAADKAASAKPGAWKQTTVKIYDTDGKVLKAGTDYDKELVYTLGDGTVLDKDCTVGVDTTVYITAKGLGNYADSRLVGSYRIVDTLITSAKVEVGKESYTGKEVRPKPTSVKVGTEYLTEGKDYEIIGYSNNINKGFATMTIKGKGKYGGTKTVKYAIGSKVFLWWVF